MKLVVCLMAGFLLSLGTLVQKEFTPEASKSSYLTLHRDR